MSIRCLVSGLEVNYPCSPVCNLFGDCVTQFNAARKQSVRTNADRIRAMSDEELAAMTKYTGCPDPHLPCGESTCYQCRLNWLRQPVKDGDNDE